MAIATLAFLLSLSTALCLDANEIQIVILSQENQHHVQKAEALKASILSQASSLNVLPPAVYLSHVDFPHIGSWTVLPILPQLHKQTKNYSWVFFAEDSTKVNLKNLIDALGKYNKSEEKWVGYALHDTEATIIHHFAFYENPSIFQYPNTASGFAITSKLVERLFQRLLEKKPNSDFSIDNAHELSLFIWDKGKGPSLQHDAAFCIADQSMCASFPTPFQPCGQPTPTGSIYFAVKTCEKFHNDRVPVVKRTWAQHVDRINFFSDIEDASIPTISLGIPNTEKGHCGKTMAIIKYLNRELEKQPEVKWIVLADDDTILSVSRLRELLTCYNHEAPMILGERYGYNVLSTQGYNYVTGGGGIVFSRSLISMLSQPGACECPSNSSPDDMFLGICIMKLGVHITHSPLFHQARPVDYAREYLQSQNSISFHKHWMIDPIQVYEKWLSDISHVGKENAVKHTEL